MKDCRQFYIDGKWVAPKTPRDLPVLNPATEQQVGVISIGSAADVDDAVAAARPRLRHLLRDRARRAARPAPAHHRGLPGPFRGAGDRPSRRRWARRSARTAPPRRAAGLGALLRAARGARRLRVREAAGHHAGRPRADRRVRLDHPVELADQPDRLQGRAGAGRRLHHGAQAVRGRAAQRDHVRRDPRRGRRPGRRLQPRQRRRRRRSAPPSPPIPTSTWCRSPARPAPASRSRPRPRRPSSASPRSSAASPRTSSSTTPTSRAAVARDVQRCFNNSGQSCNAPTRMLVPARSCMDEAAAIGQGGRRVGAGRRPDRRAHARSGRWSSEAQFEKVQRLIERASRRAPRWSRRSRAGRTASTAASSSSRPSSPTCATT